jgi:hypothetical protein
MAQLPRNVCRGGPDSGVVAVPDLFVGADPYVVFRVKNHGIRIKTKEYTEYTEKRPKSEAPKHRSTEAPKHRSTEAPKHRSTGSDVAVVDPRDRSLKKFRGVFQMQLFLDPSAISFDRLNIQAQLLGDLARSKAVPCHVENLQLTIGQ